MVGLSIKKEIAQLEASATLKINERSKSMLEAGLPVYRFGFGQSPFPIPEQVIQTLKDHASEKDYLPVSGLAELRSAIAEYYSDWQNINCRADQVFVGPGSKELMYALQIICDSDLLLPAPSWVSYAPQAMIVKNNVHWIPTSQSNNWKITASQLDNFLESGEPGSKILLLNYPSNPVGITYNAEELEALGQVARKHNLLVVSDEIYGPITFNAEHVSIARFYPEGTIISTGLSKWCGAGGWRLGAFILPEGDCSELKRALVAVASESFSAVSAPIQYAAVTAYRGSSEIFKYQKRTNAILAKIAKYVYDQLSANGVSMPEPAGGFYLFPNFELYRERITAEGIYDVEQFCEALLKKTGVALLPGSVFGRPKAELTCRLSYVDFDGAEILKSIREEDFEVKADQFVQKFAPRILDGISALLNWLNKR